jgi:hypothetical protein
MNAPPLPLWLEQAKSLLDESARDLDAATLSRLNRARQASLQLRTPRVRRSWLMPASVASACVLLMALAVWQRPFLSSQPGGVTTMKNPVGLSDGDADIVSSEDTLEFYQDLEFYAWLDAEQDNGT